MTGFNGHLKMKALMWAICLVIGLTACEQDPKIDPNAENAVGGPIPYKLLNDQSDCTFLLGNLKDGLVLNSRQQYDRQVDSINFETTPFPCERSDLEKGWDFREYTYLIYRATVGGCSAEFHTSLHKDDGGIRMEVKAHGYGKCLALNGSIEVVRIPANTDYQKVVFETEEIRHD